MAAALVRQLSRPAGWPLLLCLATAMVAQAAEPPFDTSGFDRPGASEAVITAAITGRVRARLLAERARVAPGESLDLALVLDIRPGWHTYWKNPGDSGEPLRIRWRLPDGVVAGDIQWPLPKRIPVGPLVNYGYSDRVVHLVELRVPADWPAGEPIPIAAEATWLVCEEECIPEQGRFTLTLATTPNTPARDPSKRADAGLARLFHAARAALPQIGVVAAELDRAEGELRLRVPAVALPESPEDAYFFADAWGLVRHAAEQAWSLDGEHLVLRLVPGEAAGAARATGLLKVRTTDADLGLHIDASGSLFEAAGVEAAGLASALDAGSAEASDLGLPLALGFAMLGGLVLNLMPCVFPVLAIKALGLAGQSGAGFRARALHGLAYTAGVLAFFLALGLLLLALRAGGAAVGWGFQLQSPVFVTLMVYLFLVLGMSLAGALTLGTSLMGIGQGQGQGMAPDADHRDAGHKGAFMTGGLAALVAAPCTAPFMGAALGYAMTLAWPAALAIVLALGLGMSLPLLLLTLSPGLARVLPRPGAWMETLKQALAFPMFATAAWLCWVLAIQTGPSGLGAALAGALALAFALWVQERTRVAGAPWRRIGAGTAALGLAAALWLGIGTRSAEAPGGLPAAGEALQSAGARSGLLAQPFSAARLAAARSEGRPVFVNMTAAWCITCLVNERMALSRAAVVRAFAARDLLYLKGDWTNRDPAVTDYLAGFGRNGVPMYVFYPPGGEPRVLPQVLTETIVLDGIGAT